MNLFDGLEDGVGFLVGEELRCGKFYVSGNGHKEWKFVNKHDVTSHSHILIPQHNGCWYSRMLSVVYWGGGSSHCLALERSDLRTKDLFRSKDVSSCDWTVRQKILVHNRKEGFGTWSPNDILDFACQHCLRVITLRVLSTVVRHRIDQVHCMMRCLRVILIQRGVQVEQPLGRLIENTHRTISLVQMECITCRTVISHTVPTFLDLRKGQNVGNTCRIVPNCSIAL